MKVLASLVFVVVAAAVTVAAQSTTGSVQGTIRDNLDAVVPGAAVTIRNIDTNATRTVVSDGTGHYRFLAVPVGSYELKAELNGFATYLRSGIHLVLDQSAVVDVVIRPAQMTETIEVRADAPLLNTTNAEVGVRFDQTRIAELPVRSSRNVFAIALSAPGVSELASGQTEFAGENRTGFSVNGMRLRANSWIIDGQDTNDPNANNRLLTINNTDLVQEVRLITNQFAAEFGRAAGSVVSVITKAGTNAFRGSVFAFHNNDSLNARSNLDKSAGLEKAPRRVENQFGGTIGGPVVTNRTFFFGSLQGWTDRRLGSGFTLSGAPTDEGRRILQNLAGNRPQVQALLKHLPAGIANGRSATFTVDGRAHVVPLGSLTGSAPLGSDNTQASMRIDHHITAHHTLVGRYLMNDTPRSTSGDIQVTPPGLTVNNTSTRHALNIWTNGVLGSNTSNEIRVAWAHLGSRSDAENPVSMEIPSIEIVELGMTGFLATRTRTAIGLASNQPGFRYDDVLQAQDTFTHARGTHLIKAGFDVRHQYMKSLFLPGLRGLLRYPTLDAFVADVAEAASINKPLPGGKDVTHYRWWEQAYFVQDDWRIHPALTLNIGLRYEQPGNSIQSLITLSDQILEANGNDPAYSMHPIPKTDTNNLQPRLGFNWAPTTDAGGVLGFMTGGGKFVVRGGYARTHDYAILNIAQNIAAAFPYVAANTRSNLGNAFAVLESTPAGLPAGTDPNLLDRTVVAPDFRAPVIDQFSIGIERQILQDLALRVGYVGTFGHDLFQTIDGNPRRPFSAERVDPTQGVVRVRANTAQSWYHSLQTQVDKRFSSGLSAGVHYTWSRFEDTASDIFNPSVSEVAIAQDSFNLDGEKGRSAYDRPHRLAGSFVWELPVLRDQQGIAGKVLGGWQVSSFFTFQSGSPFTVLNGADPTGALAGIDGLVGNAIRPNLNTTLDVSRMTIEEIRAAGGARLFRPLCGNPGPACPGERVGNVPRNVLRSDGIANVDFALTKNTRVAAGQTLQFRIEMFNATNTRNFGVPDGRINSANFLNQWATDGGSRRIWIALRYTF